MATINRRFYLKNEELATKSYADSSFTAARSYADTKKTEAINASNSYTDTTINTALGNYLAKNNTNYYAPSGAYNPATKQYVDEQKTQYTTMPNANSGNVGQVVQYIGPDGNYSTGHFYICVNDGGSYYWEEILVQDTPPSIPTFDVNNGNWEELQNLFDLAEASPTVSIATHIVGDNIGDVLGTLAMASENSADFYWYDENGNLKCVTLSISTDGETGDSYVEVSEIVSTLLASKAYVTGAVNTAINNLDITKREVVNQLPTENISTKTIYMVPNSTPGSENIYDEYIWLGDRWEMIGDTHIDLSTKQDVIQYGTMPTADSSNVGDVIQYIGDTTGGYEQGHFYICVEDAGSGIPVYHWEEINVQDAPDLGVQITPLHFPAGSNVVYFDSNTPSGLYYFADGAGYVNVSGTGHTGQRLIQMEGKTIFTWVNGTDYAVNPGFSYSLTQVAYAGSNAIVIYCYSTSSGRWAGSYFAAEPKYIADLHREQTVSGKKTFSTLPESSVVPTLNNQFTNKKYVDDTVAASGGCQRDTVPTADSTTVGDIIQYTGPTNEYYTNGYFYICVEQAGSGVPVYTWEQINVQDQPDLSNYVTATVLNNMELNNIRMNFPCYYIDAISFDTVEPYITPSFEDVQAIVIAKMQQAYNDGKTKFYLIYRNANSTHPLRYFPVLIDINTNTGVITTTGYKQVCSVNSTEAVSFTVSMDYGTWSLVNGSITHTGEHIGGYIVNKSTFNYLAKNNITAYTPTLDYHPATKRYVDETVTNGIDNGYGVPAVEIMPAANSANFGKVVIYSGCEDNVYWMPGHMYQCQQWEDEQHNVSYHWVEMAKRDAYDFFMPEATEENYDLIIQYKGQDTNDYKKGYFYRCAAYTDQGTVLYRWEPIAVDNYLKKDNTTSYTPTADYNPTTKKYVDDLIKPVVIWESNDPSTYLTAISANISASPAWQLTNLDMTPFKRIKIYTCAGQGTGTTASASTTAAMVLEMSLDPRAAISAYGGNYVGSTISQKPNDSNRLATLTCAVSADKTSFVVLRQTNLYGTAATANNDVNANVFLIEGYYY